VDTVIVPRLRPDGRCVVRAEGGWTHEQAEAAAEYARSQAASVITAVDVSAEKEHEALRSAGFRVSRRELIVEFTVEAALAALRDDSTPPGIEIRSATEVDVERLSDLDEELRADVPGTSGWRNDPDEFHTQTFDVPEFEPTTYLVAVDRGSGEYVGLVRVWMNADGPRLGLAGVRRSERRRGIASTLLVRALQGVQATGASTVVAEYDATNAASAALARRLGARTIGEWIEFSYRPPQHAADELAVVAGYAERFLNDVVARPVGAAATAEQLTEAFGGPLPERGADDGQVVAELVAAAEPGLVGTQSGRYFGFVIGSAMPAAVAADWLATAWDQNAFSVVTSPAAAAVETVAGAWAAELLGLPEGVSSGFVTGAQAANTTALAAARQHVLGAAGWDVARRGLTEAPQIRVLAGEERHVTIDRSLRLLGIGTAAMEIVPADAQGRMRADLLQQALQRSTGPTIVCAQAGNVNTGACDPLLEIVELAGPAGAWVHVDGAFGLWAAASPRFRHLVAGVDRADSWATDAHKWLNVPYDSGLVFTRNPEAHGQAMAVSASYLQRGGGRSPSDWVPESSRRARGFAVWAALRSLGRNGVATLVERCCDHARAFADRLAAEPGVEVLNDVVLNQVLVRFADDDATTRDVVRRVQEEGTCWLGGTGWHGRAAMRISVSSFRTTSDDVDRSVAAILEAAAAVSGALR
jgi:glutamate/tyrosine decarboxylase-like PLP-dependent enzyme/RimJ/RimL family protein N-acetyltransferase